MKDPVVNEHGYTYCKKSYLSYISEQKCDPRTKYFKSYLENPFLTPTIYFQI